MFNENVKVWLVENNNSVSISIWEIVEEKSK